MGLAAAEAMTLANFVRPERIERFVEWRKARSGGHFHQGIVRFLKAASSLCHPVTGYLTQSYERFADVVPDLTADEWLVACSTVHADVADIIADETDRAEPESSRDSFEPIAYALALPNPLDAVADAVIRMDAARPSTGGVDEAIWARDRLLLKLLASNPLRGKNARMLTFTPDGKGHLRKVDGVWRIAIPKREFKNFEGAAKDRDYDMVVRPEVWPDIERYLQVYRPMLAPPDNPYVFVSSRNNHGPMATHALKSEAPRWLVDRFDPHTAKLAHRMLVYPTADRRDHLLALLLQCGGTQMRWLMQLSDPGVQTFLLDALEHRALTFLLAIENTKQMAAMGVGFHMEEPQTLRGLLAEARPSNDGILPLAQLTTLYSNAQFGPSIVEGEDVTDLVAVMVGTDTHEQLKHAALDRFAAEASGDVRAKLH